MHAAALAVKVLLTAVQQAGWVPSTHGSILSNGAERMVPTTYLSSSSIIQRGRLEPKAVVSGPAFRSLQAQGAVRLHASARKGSSYSVLPG